MRRVCQLFAYLAFACSAGCASSNPVAPEKPFTVLFEVEVDERANSGRSVRMLVREVEDATSFLADDYASMVRLALNPDATVLADRFLRPSTSLEVDVSPSSKKTLAMYVFFTSPHPTRWKARVREGQTMVRVRVLENSVEVQ